MTPQIRLRQIGSIGPEVRCTCAVLHAYLSEWCSRRSAGRPSNHRDRSDGKGGKKKKKGGGTQ